MTACGRWGEGRRTVPALRASLPVSSPLPDSLPLTPEFLHAPPDSVPQPTTTAHLYFYACVRRLLLVVAEKKGEEEEKKKKKSEL